MSTYAAMDAGSLLAKIALCRAGADPSVVMKATGPRGERDALEAAVAAVGGTGARICLAVPDIWLNGSPDGGRRQEELRHLAEDELGLTGLAWIGQLAAVAALAASQREFSVPGRYLICDVGGSGVRAAVCDISGRTVRTIAVHSDSGGGWRDFDAAVRAALHAEADPGLGEWYRSAQNQDRRARLVLDRARRAPEFRAAKLYSLTGTETEYELAAGQAADCFAPTLERIRTGITAVLDGQAPALCVLTGGLAWFPLAAQAVQDTAGLAPVILGPEAAARGALLLAAGQADLAAHLLPRVSLPMHRIRNGLLEDVSLPLPWTAPFATDVDEPVILSGPELTLDIGNRRVSLSLPGLENGEYRVGIRASWSGSVVFVLRRERPAPDTAADVHVVPLDIQETTSP